MAFESKHATPVILFIIAAVSIAGMYMSGASREGEFYQVDLGAMVPVDDSELTGAVSLPIAPLQPLRWTFDKDLELWKPNSKPAGAWYWGIGWDRNSGNPTPGSVSLTGCGGPATLTNTVVVPSNADKITYWTRERTDRSTNHFGKGSLVIKFNGKPLPGSNLCSNGRNWYQVSVPIPAEYKGKTVSMTFEAGLCGACDSPERRIDNICFANKDGACVQHGATQDPCPVLQPPQVDPPKGCRAEPVKDAKGCITSYNVVCPQTSCPPLPPMAPPPEGCNYQMGKDAKGCTIPGPIVCPKSPTLFKPSLVLATPAILGSPATIDLQKIRPRPGINPWANIMDKKISNPFWVSIADPSLVFANYTILDTTNKDQGGNFRLLPITKNFYREFFVNGISRGREKLLQPTGNISDFVLTVPPINLPPFNKVTISLRVHYLTPNGISASLDSQPITITFSLPVTGPNLAPCAGPVPRISPGLIVGPSSTGTPTPWTYDSAATSSTPCKWKCSEGYSQSGLECLQASGPPVKCPSVPVPSTVLGPGCKWVEQKGPDGCVKGYTISCPTTTCPPLPQMAPPPAGCNYDVTKDANGCTIIGPLRCTGLSGLSALPDFGISNRILPTTRLTHGSDTTIKLYVANTGANFNLPMKPGAAPLTFKAVVSPPVPGWSPININWGANDVQRCSWTLTSMGAGYVTTPPIECMVRMPSSVSERQAYNITLKADPDNTIIEGDEFNNLINFTVNVYK